MKRGNIQRANEIDRELKRIDELMTMQSNGAITVRYTLVHEKNGDINTGLNDEEWKNMHDGIVDDLIENIFTRLQIFKKILEAELDTL